MKRGRAKPFHQPQGTTDAHKSIQNRHSWYQLETISSQPAIAPDPSELAFSVHSPQQQTDYYTTQGTFDHD